MNKSKLTTVTAAAAAFEIMTGNPHVTESAGNDRKS